MGKSKGRLVVKKDVQGRVKKEDYDVGYFAGYETEIDNRDARSPAPRKIMLTDLIIRKLPYCSNGPVDIVDTTFSSQNDGGRLILRIGKNTKTFYPSIAKRGNEKRGNGKALGQWIVKANNYYKQDEANLATAKERFREVVSSHQKAVKIARDEGQLTIREYLESGKYEQDRLTIPTQRNKISPVEKPVIKAILSQFEPWLDRELHEVSKEWPAEFKKHWTERYLQENEEGFKNNPDYKPKQVAVDTMRKYFMMINAMFNICEKKAYIHSNPMANFASLFPKKKIKPGEAQTYSLDYDNLMTFLFDESTKSAAYGKLIIAIMAVTGARNSEVYKNYIDNFQVKDDGRLFMYIPSEICKTREVGSRTVEIKHDFVKQKVIEHIEDIPRNAKGHMFPSTKYMDKHTSDYAYKELWKQVKAFFNLPVNGRMYSLRATFGTRLAKKSGIDVAANVLGDSLEIANLHYNEVDTVRKAEAMDKVFNEKEESNILTFPASHIELDSVYASVDALPDSIKKLFLMFKSGKAEPQKDHMLKADWNNFVKLISTQFNAKKITDDEAELWLMMQSS